MKEQDLENKLLFRLIKVTYVLVFILGIGLSLLIGWSMKPYRAMDTNKTLLVCDNGKKYKINSLDIFIYSEGILEDTNLTKALIACAYGVKYDYTDRYQLPDKYNFRLDYQYYTNGSWVSVAMWVFFGPLALYIVLNLARETLNYVFFGRHFQWDWLIKLITLATKE